MSPRPHAATQRAHSRLSPSGASRWMVCGGSVSLAEQVAVEERSNESANLGTAAHSLHEACLKSGKSPEAYRGKTFNGYTVDTEMIDAVEVSVEYVRDLAITDPPSLLLIEEAVKLDILDMEEDEGGGHLDAAVATSDTLYIHDYKHGAGIAVDVKGNKQLMLYALGVIYKMGWKRFKSVVLSIAQPRCPHPDGFVRSSDPISMKEMRVFEAEVKVRVAEIRGGSAPFVPGETQCRWCPAKAHCSALAKFSLDQAKADFSEFLDDGGKPECSDATALTTQQLAVAMKNIDLIRVWVGAVEERVYALLEEGKDKYVKKYFKLVEGRSQRRWVDESRVIRNLQAMSFDDDAFMPRKLLGLGAIEKLLKPYQREHFFEKFCEKPPGRPTIALTSDPRPEIRSNALEDFKKHLTPKERDDD